MKARILPLLALVPFAACSAVERERPAATPLAPAVTSAVTPAIRPPAAPVTVSATPLPGSDIIAPEPSSPGDPLAPPPEAEGIAIGEPNPAAPPPAADGRLGTTVASLGSPAETGLWLETPLVSEAQAGRIEYNGQSVSVQLRPSGGEPGSGSQISLEAMRALGAPLTGLPELAVYGS